jgi:hypothetical protein
MTKGLDSEAKAIYDRQLRLWGHDSQERIIQANIFVSLNGKTKRSYCLQEFLKNIVLVGARKVIFLPGCSRHNFDEFLLPDFEDDKEMNDYQKVEA